MSRRPKKSAENAIQLIEIRQRSSESWRSRLLAFRLARIVPRALLRSMVVLPFDGLMIWQPVQVEKGGKLYPLKLVTPVDKAQVNISPRQYGCHERLLPQAAWSSAHWVAQHVSGSLQRDVPRDVHSKSTRIDEVSRRIAVGVDAYVAECPDTPVTLHRLANRIAAASEIAFTIGAQAWGLETRPQIEVLSPQGVR